MFLITFNHCSNADDVNDMIDDIQEQNEMVQEISDAISQPIGFAAELDDVRRQLSLLASIIYMHDSCS